MMVPVSRFRIRTVVASLLLVSALMLGTLVPPAAALQAGCCICDACAIPPVTQCFEAPTAGCQSQCSSLSCGSFSQTALSCGNQPQCATFGAPAPAPALAPAGLGLAMLVVAGCGRRAMRRRG